MDYIQPHKHGKKVKMLELLEKGFDMGKIKYKHREELHER